MSTRLAKEIAQLCHNNGIGIYGTSDPSARTIFTGNLPYNVNEGIYIIEAGAPPPHQYIDTEYLILDFWSRSAQTDRAYDLLDRVYNLLHRNYDYDTANWHIYFSRALGSITDADRDVEDGKLYRLSVQFICRNLNTLS